MAFMQNAGNENTPGWWSALSTRWHRRSAIAGDWLKDQIAVADIGCGLMTLRQYLPKDVRYLPVDIVPRGADTIVVDLNRESLPALSADAAAVLGVVEYLEDPGAFLAQLRSFPDVVISYNHTSALKDMVWKLRRSRPPVTWVNQMSRKAFEQMLDTAGFSILRRRSVRVGEKIYRLKRRSDAGLSQ